MLSSFLPQGLCICFPLCLEHPLLTDISHLTGLSLHFPSVRPSLNIQYKVGSLVFAFPYPLPQCLTCSFRALITIYHFCMSAYFLKIYLQLKCKLNEGKDFVLAYTPLYLQNLSE